MIIAPEFVEKYLQRRHEDIYKCHLALQKNDMKFLERVGHQLKGNGQNFGFPDIARVGAILEVAAQTQDHKAALDCVQNLKILVTQHTHKQR